MFDLPSLPALPTLGRASRRASYPLLPEERESLLKQLGSKSLGGIAAVGNFFDLPGSVVRDVVSTFVGRPENPLDQLLPWNWFSPEHRITDREITERLGIVGPNKKGFDWGDLTSFGVGLALDPVSWISGGQTGALTKAGKLLEKAGALDDVLWAATKTFKKLPGEVGPRFAARAQTFGDVLSHVRPGVAEKITKTAERTGTRVADFLEEPIRGAWGVSVPLFPRAQLGIIGKRLPYSSALGKATKSALERVGVDVSARTPLDIIGGSIAKLTPVRHARSLLNAEMMGATSGEVQPVAKELFKRIGERQTETRGFIMGLAKRLEDRGLVSSEDLLKIRAAGEGVLDDPSGVGKTLRNALKESFKRKRAKALDVKQYDDAFEDTVLEYITRYPSQKPGSRVSKMLTTKTPEDVAREAVYKGFRRGTLGLETLLKDADIDRVIREAQQQGLDDLSVVKMAEQAIERKYGSEVLKTWVDKEGVRHNRYHELAKIMVKRPDVRTEGLFTNSNVLSDVGKRLDLDALEEESADILYEYLAMAARPGVEGKTVKEILKATKGIKTDEALELIGRQMGRQVRSADDLKNIGELVVPESVAAGLVSLFPSYKSPQALKWYTDVWDSYNNLFKAGVLTWPARFTRDRLSGMMRNVEEEMFSGRSEIMADQILHGQKIQGLEKFPIIREMLESEGLPVTTDNANRAIRLLFAKYHSPQFAIHTEGVGPSDSLADMLKAIAPETPLARGSEFGKALIGKGDSTWKLWGPNRGRIRGVRGQPKSTLAPFAAGDVAGTYTDSMNRLAPFLNLVLEKGWDPAAAMKKINWAQVSYDPRTFTPTERLLKRVLPFYSFTSRQAEYVAKKLATEPGGRMGQMIQAMAGMREPGALAPQYVSETASLPVAGTPLESILGLPKEGSERYITGFGMMFEDPVQFIGGGLRGFGLEALSRAAPIPKGLLEWAFGKSAFQKGLFGGRELESMDPALGRLFANVKQAFTGVKTDYVKPIISLGFEHAVMNSPLARAVTSARVLSESSERKGLMAKMTQLLTGLRLADISPGSKKAIARELLMSDPMVSQFMKPYVPKRLRQSIDPDERRRAEQLAALIQSL